MKHRFPKLIRGGLAALILGCVALAAGCASTPTRESTGEYIDDATITTKVKAALFADKRVSGFAVKVETFKGAVQLSGFVDTMEEKEAAEAAARAVQGTQSVINNIAVKTN